MFNYITSWWIRITVKYRILSKNSIPYCIVFPFYGDLRKITVEYSKLRQNTATFGKNAVIYGRVP